MSLFSEPLLAMEPMERLWKDAKIPTKAVVNFAISEIILPSSD